jgi:hypothetical protein
MLSHEADAFNPNRRPRRGAPAPSGRSRSQARPTSHPGNGFVPVWEPSGPSTPGAVARALPTTPSARSGWRKAPLISEIGRIYPSHGIVRSADHGSHRDRSRQAKARLERAPAPAQRPVAILAKKTVGGKEAGCTFRSRHPVWRVCIGMRVAARRQDPKGDGPGPVVGTDSDSGADRASLGAGIPWELVPISP